MQPEGVAATELSCADRDESRKRCYIEARSSDAIEARSSDAGERVAAVPVGGDGVGGLDRGRTGPHAPDPTRIDPLAGADVGGQN